MSEPNSQTDKKPERTFLSIFLLVFGVIPLVGSVSIVSRTGPDGIVKALLGLAGLAIAAVFFALSRILNYLDEIAERQRRIEDRMQRQSDKT